MSEFEERFRSQGFSRIAGVDEAGRGPLAGPVVAAACILPPSFFLADLNDSKQLTAETRARLYQTLTTQADVLYAISVIDAEEIDRINILQATFLAMQKAVLALPVPPDYLLVDGNQLPQFSIPALALVEGDARSISIAAASILAKVTRDRILEQLDEEYPLYGFKKHKGYATLEHRQAIERYGPCPIHRKSFEPIKSLLQPTLFDLL
ncbi:MAG TPA: ribonuclease HII [Parachlamydiales bacterium]|nr:ribonuclease HII [Parachlamydiales bacterium]